MGYGEKRIEDWLIIVVRQMVIVAVYVLPHNDGCMYACRDCWTVLCCGV